MSSKAVKELSRVLEQSNQIIEKINKQIAKIKDGENAHIAVSYSDNGAPLNDDERKIIIVMLETRIKNQIESVKKEQKIADAISALYKGE
mgnify:CR=1 FL=1